MLRINHALGRIRLMMPIWWQGNPLPDLGRSQADIGCAMTVRDPEEPAEEHAS
jgi:hypothetical protein